MQRGGVCALLALVSMVYGASTALHAQQRDPDTARDPLAAVRWLAGCWSLHTERRTTLEMWMPPAGGVMLGMSRTVAGGSVRETEWLRLSADSSGVSYTATPLGQRETTFRGAAATDGGFVVENAMHDFPQRIVYRRVGADSLLARIEGPGRDGGTRGINFPMARHACEGV